MKKNILNIAAILIALFGIGFGIGCLISLISSKGTLADGEYQVTVCATMAPTSIPCMSTTWPILRRWPMCLRT